MTYELKPDTKLLIEECNGDEFEETWAEFSSSVRSAQTVSHMAEDLCNHGITYWRKMAIQHPQRNNGD